MALRGYILKRAINSVILLFFVLTLNFMIFEAMPGTQGAFYSLLGSGRSTDPRQIERLIELFGLNKPAFPDRYVIYLNNMLTFKFGESFASGYNVIDEILFTNRLQNTLILIGLSTTLALAIGTLLGVLSAYKRGGFLDNASVVASLTTFSLPTFWMGLMFLLVFYNWLHWFPVGGAIPPNWSCQGCLPNNIFEQLTGRLQHIFLPAMTLTLFFYGGNLLLTRATMIETMSEDYILTARAKGLKERTVLLKHALKNASLPLITNAALQYGFLLTGAIITEQVFSISGLGYYTWQAIGYKDFPVLQAIFYLIALSVIAANFISDLLYGIIDPRIKYT